MEKSLKKSFDFRLVYDNLADASGLVPLDMLLSQWPTDAALMRNCERFWRRNATADGFLDWRGFAGGLQSALRKHDTSETTAQLDLASARRPVALVTSGEIERFLSSCHSESLVKGLAVAGRDMHRWKVSIQKQESHRSVVKQRSTETQVGSGHRHFTSLSVAREREELLRGAEVLQNTQKWFQNRLAVLSAEQQQRKIDQLAPEDILAEMDTGEEESSVLQHLKEINNHLSSLALTAPQPSAPQPARPHLPQPTAVVEYPQQHRLWRGSAWPSRVKEPQLRHSTSVPVGSKAQQPHHKTTARPLHRSSSFNDKSSAGIGTQPVRLASSMTTLSQQVTDYPGHKASPSPQRPIRHSSSVQSLPGQPHNPPFFSRPAPRAHSSRSLTQHRQHHHHLVSEVL